MSRSCIVLLSGGLDSLLVLRLMALQGLRVIALHSVNCFHGVQDIEEKKRRIRDKAFELGAREVVFPAMSDAVVELTKSPRFGYGKHLNACIDCRLRTVREGFRLMQERGASFVVSGEVIGQRPMSQRRDAMRLADKLVAEWGFGGLFLRPLCGRLLEKTIPEEEGWITSECLYDFSGRNREGQMTLADEIGIGDYPSPGGGCLLTDPEFSRKLAILMKFTPDWHAPDIELLKIGRHFQISPVSRIIASRREEENYLLRAHSRPDDRFYINKERNGAVIMLRGAKEPEAVAMAAGLAVHYSKMRNSGKALVSSWRVENGDTNFCEREARVIDPDTLRELERGLAGSNCVKEMRLRLVDRKSRKNMPPA